MKDTYIIWDNETSSQNVQNMYAAIHFLGPGSIPAVHNVCFYI